MKKHSRIDSWVYRHSEKPTHCVAVKNPPKSDREKRDRPQDARQEQYNRWSRHFRVYSGSYLPREDNRLLRQGWEDRTKSDRERRSVFRRKSTGQWVRHDFGDQGISHWHWYNWSGDTFPRASKKEACYIDRFGTPCSRGSSASHLEEED